MRPWMRKNAQNLRKNATKEENKLWYQFLRTYPSQFRRQVVFGPYILDFYCASARLAIELDGSQHFEEAGQEEDRTRTAFLSQNYGITIFRFSNLDILHRFEGVCTVIGQEMERRAPSSAPCGGTFPPVGGRSGRRSMKTVTIYTDGACSGNPGPGGWGAISPEKPKVFPGTPYDSNLSPGGSESRLGSAPLGARAAARAEWPPKENA